MQNCVDCNNDNNNACVPQETVIENVMLAHAYVPIQKMCDTFTPLGALSRGTAFPSLCGLYSYGLKGMCMIDE